MNTKTSQQLLTEFLEKYGDLLLSKKPRRKRNKVTSKRREKMSKKVTESSLWLHDIGKISDEMKKQELIPDEGDAKFLLPAACLRANRLLYERLNNGNFNYNDDSFYQSLADELDEMCKKFGLDPIASDISFAKPEEVKKALDKLTNYLKEHREEWDKIQWEPTY